MPNFSSLLKDEIARLVRKEVRPATQTLKQSSVRYRAEIAELKRRLADLERQAKKIEHRTTSARAESPPTATGFRFSAKGLHGHRERLGLTVKEMATVLDVSGQTLANWESGKTKPRASQLEAIAAVRKLGKREVQKRLSAKHPQ